MYIFHKQTEHDAWQACKYDFEKNLGTKNGGTAHATIASSASAPPIFTSTSSSNASKLSLAKSLQEAIMTTAGRTEDQFQKIWQNYCDALGNKSPPIVGLRL